MQYSDGERLRANVELTEKIQSMNFSDLPQHVLEKIRKRREAKMHTRQLVVYKATCWSELSAEEKDRCAELMRTPYGL